MEPPYVLDSAQVLMYAVLDSSVVYTGRGVAVVGGGVIDPVPRLAIVRSLYDDDILLMHCNDRWEVLGAGGYSTIEAAKDRAESAYTGVGEKWQSYRCLTEGELAEVEEIRRFLRGESAPRTDDLDEDEA